MSIFIKEDAVPHAVYRPGSVPIHYREEIKQDIDQKVKMGILEPVPPNTRTEWCAHAVIVPKKNGKPRLCVDLQQLNKQTVRQAHHTESPFLLASQIPKGWRKSVLDAFSSYHLVPIDEKSQLLTIFITIWGSYYFKRGTMGDKSAGDCFTHRRDNITKDIKHKVCCIDDACLFKPTITSELPPCMRISDIMQKQQHCLQQEEVFIRTERGGIHWL